MSLIQENSNDASFLSASKWEVSDNEARMGEFDEDPIGRDKSVGKCGQMLIRNDFSQVGWNNRESQEQTSTAHFHRGLIVFFYLVVSF